MEKEIRREIIRISKLMYEKGMVNALEGNVSVKEGSKIYITPTGICKGSLKEDMLVVVDEVGNIIEGDYQPTSEMKLHLECYRLRKDISCVIHNHSAYATAYAIANKPIESKAYPEMMIIFDKIPVVAYGTPSTDEVHEDVKNHIDKTDVFLLSRHGVVSVGRELNDAFYKIEAVESIAKKLTIVESLGGEAPLSEEQIKKLYEI
jgi:L-fuculose-phosphate aldolase